jgi:hypothetical protein
MTTKSIYLNALQEKLDTWSVEIDKLKAKSDLAKTDVRLEYHKDIQALRSRQDAAKSKP